MNEYAKKMFNLEVGQRELHTQLAMELDKLRDLRAGYQTLVEAARNVDAAFRKHRECNQLPQELYDALNEMRHMMEDAPASKSQAKRLAIQKGGE